MNVVFSSQPAYGHLHPMIPLGRALVGQGHAVSVVSSRSFQLRLLATGLEGLVGGLDWLESDIAAGFPEYAAHRARGDSKRYLQSEIFGWQTATAMAADIESLAGQRRIDLVVREPWEFGGALAAAKLGIPCVLHGIGSAANVEEVLALAEDRLRELAAAAGLAGLDWLTRTTYLDPCPPSLQVNLWAFAPSQIQAIRPEPFDTTDGEGPTPAWLQDLGGRPVVYVGLGTVMNRWHGLLERIVQDLREMDVDLVVTTGPGRDPAELGPQPTHVFVHEYVPLTLLLPKCDVIVCHAGWGTTIAALSQGLPVLAIPLGADGPRTASRCQQLGVAEMVAPGDVRPGVISTAVAKLLAEPRYRQAALRTRSEIEHMPSPTDVAQLLSFAG